MIIIDQTINDHPCFFVLEWKHRHALRCKKRIRADRLLSHPEKTRTKRVE